MTLEECRQFYSEEIRFAANINSAALVEAFARVPREDFLGSGPWKVASVDLGLGGTTYIQTPDANPRHLYHNVPVALDPARDLNNGQPAALAKWIDALGIKSGMRVYHLGCGVGYFTAIMAEMVGRSGSVVASEIDAELAARASTNLAGYANVSVHSGDGADFDPGDCDGETVCWRKSSPATHRGCWDGHGSESGQGRDGEDHATGKRLLRKHRELRCYLLMRGDAGCTVGTGIRQGDGNRKAVQATVVAP